MENQIFNESCLDTMSRMKDSSIELVVTSPPYDNLRTYDNDVDQTWSNEGDLVYDPFLGSGTTAKMSKLTKRKYLGSEINKDYFKFSQKRIDKTQEYFFGV